MATRPRSARTSAPGFTAVDEKRDPQFEAVFGTPGTVRMWAEL